ncbi:high mobility group protein HMGI-C-like [Tachyglossus aculeatus]|uniref:high mobility group protein HMGI-C-like n=1 Tax=Tachyglossus aculeatus TaxID=9261 RepID=UPI0018F52C44|nr:high mobility group protein HMGI-C-like [Tachyglossus aculeatus]
MEKTASSVERNIRNRCPQENMDGNHNRKPESLEAALPSEPPKRRRGRPPKKKEARIGPLPEKRPRGRPKGSKTINTSGSMLQVETLAKKKPRGRPRKWEKAPVEEAAIRPEKEKISADPVTSSLFPHSPTHLRPSDCEAGES